MFTEPYRWTTLVYREEANTLVEAFEESHGNFQILDRCKNPFYNQPGTRLSAIGYLFVIDGGKALRAAIEQVFGERRRSAVV